MIHIRIAADGSVIAIGHREQVIVLPAAFDMSFFACFHCRYFFKVISSLLS